MKNSELKQLIKEYVRQSMMELFAEMHIETLIENVMKKNVSGYVLSENSKEDIAPKIDDSLLVEQKKASIRQKLSIDDNTWKNIYEDIDINNNPIITGEQSENSEIVPERVLKAAGLFKDYSKFVK